MATKFTLVEELVKNPEIGPNEKIEVKLNKAEDHFIVTFRNLREYKDWETGELKKKPCGPSSKAIAFSRRFLEKQDLTVSYPSMRISVPAVDTSALILSSWPIAQTYIEPAAILKIFQLVSLVRKQRKASEIVANYKENGVFENGHFTISEKHPLATYQKVALAASMAAGNYGLLMEQGTGKTAVDVARICNEAAAAKEKGEYYRAIVICPKNVRYNWSTEIEKFATCKGKVRVIAGTQLDRGKQLVEALVVHTEGEAFSVLVMNYETVESCKEAMQLCKALIAQTEGVDFHKGHLFNLGVLDESHYIKTPSAKRTKACHELRDECEHRMVLTGTPITNNPFDLWSQLEFLGKGYSGFNTFGNFKSFFGVFEGGAMGYEKLVDLQNIPILKERLSRVSFQIRKAEALPDLPEKVYDNYEVEMTAEQTKLYREIALQLVAEIEMERDSGKVKKEFEVQHILTKLLRLAQVTSGFVGFPEVRDEETNEVTEERSTHVLKENPKLDALVDILKGKHPNEKTIVWACFVQDIQNISERLTAEGIKFVSYYGSTTVPQREEAVRKFNEDPEVKVFLGNPSAASTGINLLGYPPGDESYDTNCTHAIYYSQNWSADKRLQSEDRCHRRGTRTNIQITDLIVPGTIDVEIRQRVQMKREMAEDVGNVSAILAQISASLTELIS